MKAPFQRGKHIARLAIAFSALPIAALAGETNIAKPQELPVTVVNGQAGQSSLTLNGNVEVLRNADLIKFGQVTLGDALSRFGSVVVISGKNGEQEITLSGLGSGYTQILLNGSRAPRGFSLDSLPAGNIERVEIIRSASAEAASRGIAGTLNIVLKRVAAVKQSTYLKASVSRGWIQGSAVEGTYSSSDEGGSFFVQVSDRKTLVERRAVSERSSLFEGLQRDAIETVTGPATVHESVFAPKLEWRDSTRSLGFDTLIQISRQERFSRHEELPLTPPAEILRGDVSTAIGRDAYSATLTYRDNAFTEKASLEAKLTASTSERVSEGVQVFNDGTGVASQRALSYPSKDTSLSAKGKLGADLSSISSFEFGGQLDSVNRDEREVLTGAYLLESAYKITILDAALYGRWMGKWADADVQMGIRQEQLTLGYEDSVGKRLRRDFQFIAPQLSWGQRFGDELPSLNVALTRSMRVPDESDFSTRTYYSTFNRRSAPDQQGNPALRPELASSLEISLATPKKAVLDVRGSISFKALEDVITNEVFQEGSTWIMRSVNVGRGRIILADVSMRRRFSIESAKAYEVSYSASANASYSSVALPEGRHSSIPNVVPYQVTLNADLKKRGEDSWSTGVSFVYRALQSYEEAGGAQILNEPRRLLDFYASSSITKSLNVRLSVSNALQGSSTRSFVESSVGKRYVDVTRTNDGPTIRAALEWAI